MLDLDKWVLQIGILMVGLLRLIQPCAILAGLLTQLLLPGGLGAHLALGLSRGFFFDRDNAMRVLFV